MTIFAYLALYGWIPVAVIMFALMPSRLAATTAVIGAWLILPPYALPIAGLPDYSKSTAAVLGVLLGTFFCCPDRILMFRPRWFDLPMVFWCLSSIVSSLQNGLGLYDGLASSLTLIMVWGLPYFVGRLHFGDFDRLRYFSIGTVVGSLYYVPFCLYEMHMMQSLLINIYGLGKWQAISGFRWGGYRPSVFFWTGLECGLWMCTASLTGWWLWRCGALQRLGQFRFGPVLLPVLTATAILCRSTGAILLLAAGMIIIWLSDRLRTRAPCRFIACGTCVCHGTYNQHVVGPASRGLGEHLPRRRSCAVAQISLRV